MHNLPGVIPKTSREFYMGGQEYIRRLIPLILTLNSHKNSHEVRMSREKKHIHAGNSEIGKIWSYPGNPCQWYHRKRPSTSSRGIRGSLYGPPKKFIILCYPAIPLRFIILRFLAAMVNAPLNETSMCVSVPVEWIQGVAGQRTILPCNIQPRESNDAVSMVLWFKEDSGEPLYR